MDEVSMPTFFFRVFPNLQNFGRVQMREFVVDLKKTPAQILGNLGNQISVKMNILDMFQFFSR